MKILYTNFHPRNGGGHVTYIMNLARGLRHAHEITVATPGSSRLYRYAGELPGVRVADIRFRSRASALFGEAAALRRLIRHEGYDLIHVNGSTDHRLAMIATLGMRRPPIVFTKHNDLPLDTVGHRMRARFGTDRVIAVSEFVAGLLRRSPYGRLPIATIRHGIDTDFFAPPSAALRPGLREKYFGATAPGKILLGSSGGTDYDKGWLDLLAGLAQLAPENRQRFRVLVAGDPPDEAKMARVRELGVQDQVVFPGLLDDVRPALAACDVGFVLSYREALSFACREVMSLGLPALVSNAGGLPENVIDGRDGWVVPVRDPRAIAAVLQGMLDDPSRTAAMGAAAREKSLSDFGLAKFVEATFAVYQAALDGR
ncbi:glycosyltransferase family 4 protein [Bordetella bronchialis]|uniref:Transferase n=1 Tax=Bordetella bronchialis TaxID=463025 RepID=A0A193FYL1_9BORD|nr:glycosyltransferase family 4 protein [Bordetella bronchialis]ANN72847.1 transferase [Bordetella bronchialis]